MTDISLPNEIQPIKLIYVIGTYPALTVTFIDREIRTLTRLGNFRVRPLSLRYPESISAFSPEQTEACQNTLHLIPANLADFNFIAFIAANLFFILFRPFVYFETLIYLMTRSHPNFRSRLWTFFHFGQGVYAAYLLRHEEFDHLHAHFIDRAVLVALVISRFLGKTYSVTAHAADIYTKAVLVHEKLTNASFVVTVSRYNKEYLLKTYPGIDPDKIHILHPWVDTSHFTPCVDRSEHTRFNILSVGRLVEKKGHIDLIEACCLLQEKGLDFECRIVGEGPLRKELEKRIANYSLQERVILMGEQPPEQVLELLRSWTDVFALPCVIASNGDRDGIPVSLAEAMAVEIPVVSTDIIGIHELVQPGTGFLVPPHNAQALAGALQNLSMQDGPTRAIIGHRGRAVVDAEFNLLAGTKKLANLFYIAIAEKRFTANKKLKLVSR